MKRRLVLPAALALAAAIGPPAAQSAPTVRLGDNFFKPKTMTVAKGTTVTFRWRTKNPHSVSGRGFSSKIAKRVTYRHKFRKAGRYRLFCKVHPRMRMTLRVR